MNTKKYFITLFSFIIFSIYFTLSGVFVPFIAWNNNLGFNISDKLSFFIKIPSCFLKSSAIDSREKGAIK